MTFDGTNTKAYGLIPIKVNGGYNMPSRRGPYTYDWGDEIEPLLTATYAAWNPRTITVEFLYDPRQQTIGIPSYAYIENFIQTNFATGADIVLALTDAVSGIGTYTVRVTSITAHKKYRNGTNERMTFTFQETAPAFGGTVPVTKNGGATNLDGYNFSQFNAKIMQITNLSGLGGLKKLDTTTYTEAKAMGPYRALSTINIKLVISNEQALERLASLQKVLTGEAVLPFSYNGITFNTFHAAGFAVKHLNSKTIKFDLKLFRL